MHAKHFKGKQTAGLVFEIFTKAFSPDCLVTFARESITQKRINGNHLGL